MADIYIGDFHKKGEYFQAVTNFADHATTINFDGSTALETDDGILLGLHAISIDGLNKKSTITFPCNILLHIHTKQYEYEAFVNGSKSKSMIEPSPREQLLYKLLKGEHDDHSLASIGKGGMINIGSSANDLPILNGSGNLIKHARFVIEFDADIPVFDMSAFPLSADTATAKKSYGSKSSETESQRIDARHKALERIAESLGVDLYKDCSNQRFVVLACLELGLQLPDNLSLEF